VVGGSWPIRRKGMVRVVGGRYGLRGYKRFTSHWWHSVAAFLLWGGVSEASTLYSKLGHPLCSCSVDATPVQWPPWCGGPYSPTWQTEVWYLETWFCGPNWCYVQPLLIYWVGPVLYASCVPLMRCWTVHTLCSICTLPRSHGML